MIPILVDVDGVLSDITQACLDLAAKNYNVFATADQCTSPTVGDSIGCPYLPKDIEHETIHREFCYRMKPIAQGLEMFRELEETYGKDNVFICTSPWTCSGDKATGEWVSQRFNWLRDHLGISGKRVFIANKKFMVAPKGILIDDTPSKLKNRTHGFCIAQPYNTSYAGPRGTHKEALEYVKEVLAF